MMHTLRGPARRLAIVEIPRTPLNRLGRVGSIRNQDWTQIPDGFVPMTDEPYMPAQPTDASGNVITAPPTTAQWIASIVAAQATARETTPGTLIYTPAPRIAPPTIARWNSWAGPCAIGAPATSGDGSSSAAAAAAPPPGPIATSDTFNIPALFYVAAALAAAASAAYFLDSLTGRK